MGLSTADSKQVLCHMILFKVLSLGLLRSLWSKPVKVTNSNKNLASKVMSPYFKHYETVLFYRTWPIKCIHVLETEFECFCSSKSLSEFKEEEEEAKFYWV
jgi:hypothetical protein